MRDIVGTLTLLYFTMLWLAGIALAEGGFVLLAIFFPFYAWYLAVKQLMVLWGML